MTQGKGPRLLMKGEPAMKAVARLLPGAQTVRVPTNLGPVELKPGTILNGRKMIVQPTTWNVVYLIDDELYEWDPANFMRDVYIDAMSQGAQRATGMIYLAQVECALLSGIFCPWYLLLGVSAVKLGVFYKREQRSVDEAFRQAPRVLRLLQQIKQAYPTLFNKMASAAARDILVNMPSGVTAEDVAFFVGRVIKGVAGLPEVTLGAVAKTVAVVASLVTATHLPAITAHAIQHAASHQAQDLQRKLREPGIVVNEAEAHRILSELKANKQSLSQLTELENAAKSLIPALQQLQRVFRAQ